MVQKEDPGDPLRASNEANMIDAKLTQISPFKKIFKDGAKLQDWPWYLFI